MDIDLFLVIPIALVWDIFVKKQEENARQNSKDSSKYIKRQVVMGIMFVIFACLFIITYVIFNHYINIDQIKLPSVASLSSLTGSEEVPETG
jgi:hypothetical protein